MSYLERGWRDKYLKKNEIKKKILKFFFLRRWEGILFNTTPQEKCLTTALTKLQKPLIIGSEDVQNVVYV